MSETLDPRLHAFRSDLADDRLAGRVSADRFVTGDQRRIALPSIAMKPAPDAGASTSTELLCGETVQVFEDHDGWSWLQLETDGYVGYVPSSALEARGPAATHRVSALGTFAYPEPNMKLPPSIALSLGACLVLNEEVEIGGTTYRMVEGGGAVIAAHVTAIDAFPDGDFVAVAERFLHTPYLWGGRTNRGVDCSALVQLALQSAGIRAPRDTDLQEAMVGRAIEGGVEALCHPGDLVFWPGHVAMMIDGEYMIHASGHHMMVVIEPLAAAMARIGTAAGRPTSVKRP